MNIYFGIYDFLREKILWNFVIEIVRILAVILFFGGFY